MHRPGYLSFHRQMEMHGAGHFRYTTVGRAGMNNLRSTIQKHGRETFSSLYVRNYRLYYIGQIISTSGTFMQSVAQAWLVLQMTNSGTALGIATALQYVPILFLGPYGGVVADRLSNRKILYF